MSFFAFTHNGTDGPHTTFIPWTEDVYDLQAFIEGHFGESGEFDVSAEELKESVVGILVALAGRPFVPGAARKLRKPIDVPAILKLSKKGARGHLKNGGISNFMLKADPRVKAEVLRVVRKAMAELLLYRPPSEPCPRLHVLLRRAISDENITIKEVLAVMEEDLHNCFKSDGDIPF